MEPKTPTTDGRTVDARPRLTVHNVVRILGISCYFRDAAAALLEDGLLIAAAEEERFTRMKHDSEFPRKAIDFCLKQGDVTGQNLDYVTFFDSPGVGA